MGLRFFVASAAVGLLGCGGAGEVVRPVPRATEAGVSEAAPVADAPETKDAAAESAPAPAEELCVGQASKGMVEGLSAKAAQAKSCYVELLRRDPTARGRVKVRLRLARDGTLSEPGPLVVSDGLGDAATLECILTKFRGGIPEHPPIGGCANVVVPLVFVPRVARPDECAELDSAACMKRALDSWSLPGRTVERARALLSWACSEGNSSGCLGFGLSLRLEEPKDRTHARRVFAELCDGGLGGGCTNVAGVDEELGDAARALASYERGCELGDAEGCVGEALRYRRGLGVAADPARALRLNRRACDLGSPTGCNNLGDMHEVGDASPPDASLAEELYAKVCAQPWDVSATASGGPFAATASTRAHAFGCYSLANLKKRASGGKSTPEVRRLLKTACAGGVEAACGEGK